MLYQLDPTVAMLVGFRIMALLVGAFLLYLGYGLFKLGYFEKGGEFEGRFGKKRLRQVAPGVFFALFGTIIVCVGIWKPISIDATQPTPTATIITSLRKVAANQQLSDAERAEIGLVAPTRIWTTNSLLRCQSS
jgi:hypothetical protein